jgi:membrane-associated phospholipid phosphatase
MAVLVRIFLTLSLFSSSVKAADSYQYGPSWQEFQSPWKTDAKYIFWGGLGLAIFLKQATPDFVESTQRTWSQDKPLGTSKVGDYLGQGIPNLIYFTGFFVDYYFSHDEKSFARAVYMAKTSLYATAFAHVMKLAWQEPRPDDPNTKDSFPSGHTTAAFAFASTVGMEHGVYWGTAGYLLATYAGLSRINDNRHRLNDVVAGAAIGISYGMGVYSHNNPSKSTLIILPSEDLDGVVVNYATPF